MNSEEKKMYQILKKCILKQSKKPNDVHFFSEYLVTENNDYLDFKSMIYDDPNYGQCGYVVNSCSYSVYLRFKKRPKNINEEITTGISYERGLTNEDQKNKNKKKEYHISVEDPLINDEKFSEPIISLIDTKPFFENRFMRVYFRKENSNNTVDKSIFKTEITQPTYINQNFVISLKNNLFGVVNTNGKVTVPYEYNDIHLTKYGFMVRKDKNFFFIDLNNKAISKVYEKIDYHFGCNNIQLKYYLLVKSNGLYNFIDSTFTEKFENGYSKINIWNENPLEMLVTKEDTKVIFDAVTWKETSFVYDDIELIDKELIQVKIDDKYGLIKRDKTTLLDIKFDEIKISIDNYPDFFFIVKENNKFGLVNKNGELVTEVKYEKIEFVNKTKTFEGKIDNKIEMFDINGIK